MNAKRPCGGRVSCFPLGLSDRACPVRNSRIPRRTVLVRPQQPRSGLSSFRRKVVARSLTEQFSWLSVLSLGSIDVLAFRLFTVL